MRKESITEKNIAPEIVSSVPWRLTKVAPMDNYCLEVRFVDGVKGVVNMKSLIMSQKAGVFAKLREIETFNQVHLTYGVATWLDEIDLAPDVMHDEIKRHGQWVL